MAQERVDIVTVGGNPVTLLGPEIQVGDKAPGFEVVDQDKNTVSSDEAKGKVRIYSVVHSLDTGICDQQTRRFNEQAAALGDQVEIWTLSVDLPFALKRWCGAAGIDNIRVLSDHRELSFGMAYGLVIKELRLLARAIFVVDDKDTVRYREILPEVGSHPDYDAALEAARTLTD